MCYDNIMIKMNIPGIREKEYTVGLDIGSSSVKMVQVAAKNGGTRCVRTGLEEIRRPASESGAREAVVSAIRHVVAGIDLTNAAVMATMNSAETVIKTVTVPHMPKTELQEALRHEAKNYFSFPIDASTLGFEILSEAAEKGVKKIRVMVAATPAAAVRDYIGMLGDAGIKPASLTPAACALREYAARVPSAKGKTACHIDIGELYTELIICRDKDIVFSRKLPVAGADFTKALTGAVAFSGGKAQPSLEEAEQIKRETGLPADNGPGIVGGKIPSAQLYSMLRSPAEQLADEVGRCFDYCREESEIDAIDEVFLYGGGASLGGLAAFLSGALGIEARPGSIRDSAAPPADSASPAGDLPHRLEIAMGAALARADGVNLLPPEIRYRERIAFVKTSTIAIAAAALLAMSVLFAGMKMNVNGLQKKLTALRAEYGRLEPSMRRAEALILANKVLVNEPYWRDVFAELAGLTPDAIYLEEVKMGKGVMTIRGVVAAAGGEQILSDYILNLEKGLFSGVKLVRSKALEEKTGMEFELKCWIDYENP